MIDPVHPAFIFIVGALLLPFLKNGNLKKIYLLMLPLFAGLSLYSLPQGTYWTYKFMDYTLTMGRVDPLSKVFGYAFVIIAFCAMLYELHVKEDGHHLAAYVYAGSALGVVFAGDLISLYIFWEIMAVASAALIFYRRTKDAIGAGMRYLVIHATGGILLLGGIMIYINATGSYAFNHLDYGTPGTTLILLGFIINAAVPPLHAWLSDAYPEATITGVIFLMAFTTKSAVYVLIRGYSGLEILMWLGAMMAVYGVVFAMLQNDIRRVLSYHIISQVGYMVAGVGMGTFLAINGSAAHAFSHILYKGLLFMGAGAIIYMTGKQKLTELGGLYKTMPVVFILFMIGAFSISGVPFFNGFISKPMIIAASGELHQSIIYTLLLGAGVGTFLCLALKIPYLTFFGKGEPQKLKKLPNNMLAAMGIVAALCIMFGLFPQILYNILPNPVEFAPYTVGHVTGEFQLLLFTVWAFLMLKGIFVAKDAIVLDVDWTYRKAGKWFTWFINNPLAEGSNQIAVFSTAMKDYLLWFTRNPQRSAALVVDLLYPRTLTEEELANEVESDRRKFTTTVHRTPIGDSITMVLFFFFAYMVYYLFSGNPVLREQLSPFMAWILFTTLLLIVTIIAMMLFVIPMVTFVMSKKITNK